MAVGWLCIIKSHPPQGETPFLPWLKTRGFLEDFYDLFPRLTGAASPASMWDERRFVVYPPVTSAVSSLRRAGEFL